MKSFFVIRRTLGTGDLVANQLRNNIRVVQGQCGLFSAFLLFRKVVTRKVTPPTMVKKQELFARNFFPPHFRPSRLLFFQAEPQVPLVPLERALRLRPLPGQERHPLLLHLHGHRHGQGEVRERSIYPL